MPRLETLREVLEEVRPGKRPWARAILAGQSPYHVSQVFGVSKDTIYDLKITLENLLREALRRKGSTITDPEKKNDFLPEK
jgi:hypothetical protein